jgi:beta-1,4-mannosyltransferase
VKVAMLPRSPWVRDNPYLDLLEEGLHENGVETANDPNDGLSWRWAIDRRHEIQVLHLHWLSQHYVLANGVRSALALALFAAKLALVHQLGYRIVWTVHNLQPHEQRYPRLDRLCWSYVARMADRVIVHSHDAEEKVATALGRRRHVYVVNHPHYISVYPNVPPLTEARRRLELADAELVLLCLGAVRRYKGFQDAITAFHQWPNDRARLVIAGRPFEDGLADELRAASQGDARVRLNLEFIPNSEVPTYLAAANAMLLPFRQIDTSGSAILAMSLRRPVITPAMGSLPELVTPGTGILYDPRAANGLSDAMRRCGAQDLLEMGEKAFQRVAGFTPYKVARQHLAVYQS